MLVLYYSYRYRFELVNIFPLGINVKVDSGIFVQNQSKIWGFLLTSSLLLRLKQNSTNWFDADFWGANL